MPTSLLLFYSVQLHIQSFVTYRGTLDACNHSQSNIPFDVRLVIQKIIRRGHVE